VVTWTLSPTTSGPRQRENASSAAFDATYAEKRGVLVCTPIDDTLMMWPRLLSRIPGRNFMMSFSAPK
jgi:hypothetical protein